MPLSDQERSEIARLGGLARSAEAESGSAMTETARRTFRQSFYDATSAELAPPERQRQADAAYTAHMLELSRKARKARARKRAARLVTEAAELLNNADTV
jgi:hypothetical protein